MPNPANFIPVDLRNKLDADADRAAQAGDRNCAHVLRQLAAYKGNDAPQFARDIGALLTPFESEASLFAAVPSWYSYLFAHLGPSLDDVKQSKLSVVTFNYDRSFEHHLFTALQNAFNLPTSEVPKHVDHGTSASKFLHAIPVVHVYGKLGSLPYVGGENARPYEPPPTDELAGVAVTIQDSIKIMHQGGGGDNLALGRAAQLVGEADVICFLGFGYLEENLKRLGLNRRKGGCACVGVSIRPWRRGAGACRSYFRTR